VDKISLEGEETSVLESRGRHGQEPRQMEEKPDWIDMSFLPQVQTHLFYPNRPIKHLHLQGYMV